MEGQKNLPEKIKPTIFGIIYTCAQNERIEHECLFYINLLVLYNNIYKDKKIKQHIILFQINVVNKQFRTLAT